MRREQAIRWFYSGSLLLSLFLLLVPLPTPLEPGKPNWLALVLVFWVLESPRQVPLGLAFLLGLVADLLVGPLFGGQALRLTLIVFLISRSRAQMRFFPMWQQMAVIVALLLFDRWLQFVVQTVVGVPVPPWPFWLAPFIGALLWPFLFLLLDRIYARLRVHEA